MKNTKLRFISTTLVLCLAATSFIGCDKKNNTLDSLKKDSKPKETTEKEKAKTQLVESSDGVLSLELPEGWKSNPSLQPEATLVYHTLLQDKFVMTITEPKSGPLDGYSLADYTAAAKEYMASMSTDGVDTDLPSITVDGMEVSLYTYTCTMGGVKIGYLIGVLETEDNFIRIATWCEESKLDSNLDDFTEIIKSFKAL